MHDLFNNAEIVEDPLVAQVLEVKKEMENVRRGLFRRYQDLRKENESLREDLQIIKKHLDMENYEAQAEIFVFNTSEPAS